MAAGELAASAALLQAGEQLFASQGYTGTSMAQIARAAGVAVGSVYRLFPDKPSLLAALHEAMEERFIAALQRGWHASEPYAERFGPMLEALFKEAEAVREAMPLYAMTRDMIGAADYVPGVRMIAAIEALYAEGLSAGVYRSMPEGLVGPLAHGMVDGAMRAWMQRPTRPWRNKVVTELEALFRLSFVAA